MAKTVKQMSDECFTLLASSDTLTRDVCHSWYMDGVNAMLDNIYEVVKEKGYLSSELLNELDRIKLN